MNLIHLGPVVDLSPMSKAERILRFRAFRLAASQRAVQQAFASFQLAVRKHQLLWDNCPKDFPRATLARHDILRVTIAWDSSPQIAVPLSEPKRAPDRGKPSALASRAELRALARANRVPLPMLWERFPPSDFSEQKQMQKELGAYFARQAPKDAKRSSDGFATFLRQQAKDTAKLAGNPDLYGRLLADSEWKARQRATFDGLMSEDLDLGEI